MTSDYIWGKHQCFECERIFEWEAEIRVIPYQVRKLPDVQADAYAVGKKDGNTEFEIVCKCPNCKVRNKFIYI